MAAAAWADDITISIGADSFRYQSDGIPDHTLPDAYVVPNNPGSSPIANLPVSEFSVHQPGPATARPRNSPATQQPGPATARNGSAGPAACPISRQPGPGPRIPGKTRFHRQGFVL